MSAPRHLIDILALDQVNPALAAGEIITTGTLTRALPVPAGETWTTKLTRVAFYGIPLRLSYGYPERVLLETHESSVVLGMPGEFS